MEIPPVIVKIIFTAILSILSWAYILWAMCQDDVPDWYKALSAVVLFLFPPAVFTSLIVLAWIYL